ncbi:MAG: hypothetical protein ACFFD4_26795 [Candidatus Odinarchaeota archaeon]
MEPGKTGEQTKFLSMLDGIRGKFLVTVVDAELLDVLLAEEELNGSAVENKG